MHICLISFPRLREYQRRVCQNQKAVSSGRDGTTALMDSQHLWFPVHNPQKTKPATVPALGGHSGGPTAGREVIGSWWLLGKGESFHYTCVTPMVWQYELEKKNKRPQVGRGVFWEMFRSWNGKWKTDVIKIYCIIHLWNSQKNKIIFKLQINKCVCVLSSTGTRSPFFQSQL